MSYSNGMETEAKIKTKRKRELPPALDVLFSILIIFLENK